MDVPYDQQHDESVDRPNIPQRGMHGQSFASSAPWDERAQHAHEKIPVPTKETTEPEAETQPRKPGTPPRGVHGESVMRSTPYDERQAKEIQEKMLEATKEDPAPRKKEEETLGDDEATASSPTKAEGEIPADGNPTVTPTEAVASSFPKAEREPPAVEGAGIGKKAAAKVNNLVGATIGKVKGLVKK